MRVLLLFLCYFALIARGPDLTMGAVITGLVSTGDRFTCRMLENRVACWGYALVGATGNTETLGKSVLKSVTDIRYHEFSDGTAAQVNAVTGSGETTCALFSTGRVRCWGSGKNGQLANGVQAQASNIVGYIAGDIENLEYITFADTVPVTKLSMGPSHGCAIYGESSVRCWGRSREAQTGYGIQTSAVGSPGNPTYPTPSDLPYIAFRNTDPAVDIAVGDRHSCAVFKPGSNGDGGIVVGLASGQYMRCWGSNAAGQTGARGEVIVGLQMSELSAITLGSGFNPPRPAMVYAGGSATCIILQSGSSTGGARCWGNNELGQAGQDDTNNHGQKTALTDLTDIQFDGTGVKPLQLSMSMNFVCAVMSTGGVRCWGGSASGALGHPTVTQVGHDTGADSITTVQDITFGTTEEVIQVSTGTDHACALFTTHRIICWGAGTKGALGTDAEANVGLNPAPVSGQPFIKVGHPRPETAFPMATPLRPNSAPIGSAVVTSPYIPLDFNSNLIELYNKSNPVETWQSQGFYVAPTLYFFLSPVWNHTGTVVTEISTDGEAFSSTAKADILVYADPVITQVIPASGPIQGGTLLQLKGEGLENASDSHFTPSCCFGDTGLKTGGVYNSTYQSVFCYTPTNFNATVLKHTYINVTVALNGEQCAPGGASFYLYDPSSYTMKAFAPNLGPLTGGTRVSLELHGPLEDTGDDVYIRFDKTIVMTKANVTKVSNTTWKIDVITFDLTTFLAEGAPGSQTQVLINADLFVYFSLNSALDFTQSTYKYRYHKTPTVVGMTPNADVIAGGAMVRVHGTEFRKSDYIMGMFTDAYGVSVITNCTFDHGNKKVLCVAPPAANAGYGVLEIALNGQQYTTSYKTFSYYQLTSITPTGGGVAGGTDVTLTGDGFVVTLELGCKMGTVEIPADFLSPSQLVCTSPAHPAGPVPIEAKVVDGRYTASGLQYVFYARPTVSSFTPTSAPADPQTSVVTLFGSGFVSLPPLLPKVKFGSVIATALAVNVSGQSISVKVPPGNGLALLQLALNAVDYDQDGPDLFFSYFSLTSVSPPLAPLTGGSLARFDGSRFADAAYCRFGSKIVTGVVESGSAVACEPPPQSSPMVVPVEVSADGIDFTNDGLTFRYYPQVHLSAINPPSGVSVGLTTVNITGTNITRYSPHEVRCKFGSQVSPQVPIIHSSTLMTCVTPSGGGPAAVEVSLNGGVDYSSSGIQFEYFDAQSVEPVNGPVTGGTLISVTGYGFSEFLFAKKNHVMCRFNNSKSLTVPAQFVKESVLACPTPAVNTNGTVNVQVTTNGGEYTTTPVLYKYDSVAIVSTVIPTSGPAQGGAIVTITGSNFLSTASCKFGAASSTATTFVSASRVICVSPAGGGTVTLELSFNQVDYVTASSFSFFSLFSISPPSGPASGGTLITVSGSGFSSASPSCRVGNVNASAAIPTARDQTRLVCTAPALSALGTLSVDSLGILALQPSKYRVDVSMDQVFYAYGPGAASFQYYDVPTISSISPTNGPTTGGTPVTMRGSGFIDSPLLACRFGGVQNVLSPARYIDSSSVECNTTVHSVGDVTAYLTMNSQQVHAGLTFTFTQCAAGEFSRVHTEPCTPCAKGDYNPDPGARQCQPCGPLAYSDTTGATSCLPCPSNSSIPVNVIAQSLSLCECNPDFYTPDGKTGTTCIPCPSGSTCAGGTAAPLAQVGYWNSRSAPYTFVACADGATSCPGGPVATCADGHTGRLCAECENGYYHLGTSCEKCPEQNGQAIFYFAAFILFCYAVCIGLLKIVEQDAGNSSGGTVTIFTTSFQVLAMLGDLQLEWPYVIQQAIAISTLPVTLKLDFIASECSMPGVTFVHKWAAMMAIPFVFLFIFGNIYLVAKVHAVFFQHNAKRSQEEEEREREVEMTATSQDVSSPGDTSASPSTSSADDNADAVMIPSASTSRARQDEEDTERKPIGVRVKEWLTTPTDMASLRNRTVNALCMFFSLVYLLLVSNALLVFRCQRLEDGEWTLVADPSLLCYADWWWSVMPVALVALGVYGVLMPLTIGLWIRRNRHRLREPFFAQRYGSIYANFTERHAYFESVIMIEKMVLAGTVVVVTANARFQVACVLAVLVSTLLVHILTYPYKRSSDNQLSATMQWSLMLTLMVGSLLFTPPYPFAEMYYLLIVLFFILLAQSWILIGLTVVSLVIQVVQSFRFSMPRELSVSVNLLSYPHGRKSFDQWWVTEGHVAPGNVELALHALKEFYITHDDRDISKSGVTENEEVLGTAVSHFSGDFFSPRALRTTCAWITTMKNEADKMGNVKGAHPELAAFLDVFHRYGLWRYHEAQVAKSSVVRRVMYFLGIKISRVASNAAVIPTSFGSADDVDLQNLVDVLYATNTELSKPLICEMLPKVTRKNHHIVRLSLHTFHRLATILPEANADASFRKLKQATWAGGSAPREVSDSSSESTDFDNDEFALMLDTIVSARKDEPRYRDLMAVVPEKKVEEQSLGDALLSVLPPALRWDNTDAETTSPDDKAVRLKALLSIGSTQLDLDSDIAQRIISLVRTTSVSHNNDAPLTFNVVRVDEVQNHRVSVQYDHAKDFINAHMLHGDSSTGASGGGGGLPGVNRALLEDADCNEYLLWHGMHEPSVDVVVAQGFLPGLSNLHGMFGAGIYFAEHLSKSHQYVHLASCDLTVANEGGGALEAPEPDTPRPQCTCRAKTDGGGDDSTPPVYKVLLCRVVLGDAFLATNTMHGDRVAPLKTESATQGARYDSVYARASDATTEADYTLKYNEFVVFEKAQIYPAYIVHYTIS